MDCIVSHCLLRRVGVLKGHEPVSFDGVLLLAFPGQRKVAYWPVACKISSKFFLCDIDRYPTDKYFGGTLVVISGVCAYFIFSSATDFKRHTLKDHATLQQRLHAFIICESGESVVLFALWLTYDSQVFLYPIEDRTWIDASSNHAQRSQCSPRW